MNEHYIIECNDEFAASVSGPKKTALRDALHYFSVYRQDGPVALKNGKGEILLEAEQFRYGEDLS